MAYGRSFGQWHRIVVRPRTSGQALADVATIGILQQRAIGDNTLLIKQLQTALNSRVVIEQAKGVLSSHGGVDMDHAFGALRSYARSHNLLLSDLARTVGEGTADLNAILPVTLHGRPLGEPRRRGNS